MANSLSSPCVHLCQLNAQQECIGCGRLLEEIAHWRDYSEAERQAILQRLQAQKPQSKEDDAAAAAKFYEDNKHERIRCLRCGERFLCKMNSPSRCDCVDIPLTPDEREYILPLADGECLCPNCLEQLRAEYRLLHGF